MSIENGTPLNHPRFLFYLRRSGYVHIGLVALALISGKIAFELNEAERSKNLELIQASVRVDMVAMPTHTLNELKKLSETPIAKPAEVEVEDVPAPKEVVEEKQEEIAENNDEAVFLKEAEEKKRQDFLNKLKKISNTKINKAPPKKEVANKKAGSNGFSDSQTAALDKLVLSGNKLSSGTATFGDGGGGELTAFQAYASKLPDLIRPYWTLPSFLMDKKLQARVRVWLNMKGEITRVSVYQSSGDTEYDQRALEAVRAAGPFPELSDEFGRRAMNGDILLGFPL